MTKSSKSLSSAVATCERKTEKEPGQEQQNEEAKRLGEYLNFRTRDPGCGESGASGQLRAVALIGAMGNPCGRRKRRVEGGRRGDEGSLPAATA